ncbi:DUF5590 domain-containing protein [Bacillus sp. FJAT-50079]|uniref:cell wall elongation regulator TseB-like domain-containing protein n=1 Tax=Bacillus sp. FJAT-50079 TaxID=2833577 RepID=UPI001BC92ABD|nr:DUF5590 domain-containing protein [Bacillus sp. FJAT-50079]MBS4209791.1 DUF5590 domain-containing protein [Bacillus sp. FJAT-50079]
MKKWIVVISLFVIAFSTTAVVVYIKAREPMKTAQTTAENRAMNEAGITEIEKFYLYNGNTTVYTIIGKQSDGNEIVVWVPADKKQKIITRKMSEGVTEEEAIHKLYQEQKPDELLAARLGLEGETPIWELAYLDEKSNLNYYLIDFETGKWWKTIENL